MLYIFYVECHDKMPINKRYNAYSVVVTHGKQPRVAFAFARQPWAIKGTTPMVLQHYVIYNGGYIHCNIDTFCYLFIRMLSLIVLENKCFNAISVTLSKRNPP